jgi:hypothetical protein
MAYDGHDAGRKTTDRWPRLTLISSQFIYLVLIVTAFLRLLDGPLLHRESRPQPRQLQLEPWLQVRAGEYHPDPLTSDSIHSNISMEDDQAIQTVANLL